MGYRHSVTTFPAICVLSGIVSNSFQACKAQTCVVQREYEGRFQAPSSPTTPIYKQKKPLFCSQICSSSGSGTWSCHASQGPAALGFASGSSRVSSVSVTRSLGVLLH